MAKFNVSLHIGNNEIGHFDYDNFKKVSDCFSNSCSYNIDQDDNRSLEVETDDIYKAIEILTSFAINNNCKRFSIALESVDIDTPPIAKGKFEDCALDL